MINESHQNHINQPSAGNPSSTQEKDPAEGYTKRTSDVLNRAWVAFACICFLALAIIVKVFVLQLFPDERAQQLAQNFTYKVNEIEPVRGQILSSDGSLLATSVPEYEIRWDSKAPYDEQLFLQKLDSMALSFSRLFGDRSSAEYKSLFIKARKEKDRYKEIKSHVDFIQLQQVKKFPFVRNGQFKGGFIYVQKNKRQKPFGSLAARTIGLEREDNKVGIEQAYNKELSGKKGKQLQEKIAGGVWKPMTNEYIEEPEPGCDVVSTINMHWQDVAHASLKRKLEEKDAAWGCVVLMEVKTGYVRAIANLTKNPKTGEYQELLNLAISQSVEPGSTMKLASLMAAIDEGLIAPEDSIDTGNGRWQIHDMTLTDSEGKGHNKVTVEEVFELSSNIGTAKLIKNAYEKNPQQFLDKLNSFGLGEPLGINLAGETKPRIYKSVKEKGWSGLSLTQLSIGYELQCTPLQTLAFYNGVANGGKIVRPQFVQEIRRNGRTIERMDPEVIRQGYCKKETLQQCRKMMEGVTEAHGTAEFAFKDCVYKVAGKTGTAKIHENGNYDMSRHRASFVGYFPADNPKYSCIVVIHDPRRGSYYGSTVAAPVFRDLAEKVYSTQMEYHQDDVQQDTTVLVLHKIPVAKNGSARELKKVYAGLQIKTNGEHTSDWVSASTKESEVELIGRPVKEGMVPNAVGMGLQDALYLLENAGLKVKVIGYGTVKRQSVTPGSSVKTNPYITIELS